MGSRSAIASFALGAAVVAAASAAALATGAVLAESAARSWAALGFLAMALPIIVSGAWLAREQGRAGASFVVAMGAGLLARAGLLVLVVAAAARRGAPELTAALLGLAAGFVPLLIFEIVWFARRTRWMRPPAELSR